MFGAQVYDDGRPSPFLQARLVLAKQLYDAGKVRALLGSGDNSRTEYDEPGIMRSWLISHGVPERTVVADFAGFDTYDTCTRANKIFGVRKAILVSQSYHLPRAVTLCRHAGVDATGVGDETARINEDVWRAAVTREWLADGKAALDVVSGRDPVYLGRHETDIEDALRD